MLHCNLIFIVIKACPRVRGYLWLFIDADTLSRWYLILNRMEIDQGLLRVGYFLSCRPTSENGGDYHRQSSDI